VPCVRVYVGVGDDPVFGDFAGDAPQPVNAVGSFDGFHVLPGHQRASGPTPAGPARPAPPRRTPISAVASFTSAETNASLAGWVIPVDAGLAQPTVVVPGAHRRDLLGCAGYLPTDPVDRGDQLGDGVLSGHRYRPGSWKPPPGDGHLRKPIRQLIESVNYTLISTTR
jgi:hypothetical protein